MNRKLAILAWCCLAMAGCQSQQRGTTAHSASESPAGIAGVASPLRIADFKSVERGMEEAEVYRLVGKPTRHAGSGIAYDVYDLADGSSVWIAWERGEVSWLFHRDLKGRETLLNQESKGDR
jgi:hypothetical protein